MASLKTLKTRKTTVQSIKKVTHAMKLVSASKLRRSREATEASRSYMKILNSILGYVYKEMKAEQRDDIYKKFPLLFGREAEKYLLIVIGSDRGLCGAFNNNVIKKAKENLSELLSEGKEISVLCVGDRAYRSMRHIKGVNVTQLTNLPKTHEEIKTFSRETVARFHRNEFDECRIYYTHFVSPITQEVRATNLIPLQKIIEEKYNSVEEKNESILECSPEPISLLKDLIPQLLDDTVFSLLQDTIASEHAARMTAMDNATRNANDMIDSLSAEYNKKRQAAITTELVEIISGAEVIKQQQ
jgi:F-type H+-transporting ATPase subunit gamma